MGTPQAVSFSLHVERFAEGAARRVVLIHGILGSARNLATLGRLIGERHPDTAVLGVDLRNHGRSLGAPPPHTLAACATDIVRAIGEVDVVIGHSFGAKVALELARQLREGRYGSASDARSAEGAEGGTRGPIRVGILDAPLSARPAGPPNGDGELERVFGVLKRFDPTRFTRRDEATAALVAEGLRAGVARWLATSLTPRPDGALAFRFHMPDVEAMLADYFRRDDLQWLHEKPASIEVTIVLGGKSDRVDPAERLELEALRALGKLHLDVLPGAGHWLHSEDPRGVLDRLAPIFVR